MGPLDLDRAGRSDLHYAALEDRADDVRHLIEQGADLNLADRNGYTPLHLAAQQHPIEALRLLLSAGALLELEDSYGNTPLWRATMDSRGRGDAIVLLHSAGADPWHENRSGASPVTIARRIANFDIRQWYSDLPEFPTTS